MKRILLPLILAASTLASAQTATTSIRSNVVTVTCKSPAKPLSPVSNLNGVVTVYCQLPAPVVPKPTISSFSVTPTKVTSGGTVIISYVLANATSATLSNGSQTGTAAIPSASASTTVSKTTTFTLTATNSAGSATKSITVTVSAPSKTPPPANNPPSVGGNLTACQDITQSGTYILANDVSSEGSCFGIDANGIVLNLNGHTITYGTGGGSAPTPAIEAHDCWSTSNPGYDGPCGSAHGGLEVYGGTIVQSPNSATFSPVFGFGQGTFNSAPYIHDITATFQNTGAQFYNSTYVPSGAKIENNKIYDNVTSINMPGQSDQGARSHFQGQAIYIGQNRNNPGTGDQIENNTIVGSPQGGLYSDNQSSVYSGNDISMNARYSNDFCVATAGDGQVVTNNNCHPVSGRGVHINANNVSVKNNVITVTELKQNAEYGGCEGGGTYGIQVEWDTSFLPAPPVGIQVTGNTITATAGDCNALGLRITSFTPAGSANFTGNTITTNNNNGAGQDFAVSNDGTDNSGITILGNTISSKYAYADGEWDGFSHSVIGHNTWLGTPKFTFVATDGGCDPSQDDSANSPACPATFEFTDTLPNTVSCGSYSEATVTIGGQVTQCKAKE